MFASPGLDLLASLLILCADCSAPRFTETTLASFPIQDLTGIVTPGGVLLDLDVSSDRNGSLRVTAGEPMTVSLYELSQLEAPSHGLGYIAFRASLRAEDLDGVAYLAATVLKTDPSDKALTGVSRSRVSGTLNWSRHEAALLLSDERVADRLHLDLVIEGRGTVWVDDIRVLWIGYPH